MLCQNIKIKIKSLILISSPNFMSKPKYQMEHKGNNAYAENISIYLWKQKSLKITVCSVLNAFVSSLDTNHAMRQHCF